MTDPGRICTFAVVANGAGDGPAQALRDHLIERGDRVLTVLHPLTPEHGTTHVVTKHAGRKLLERREISPPLPPPLSYALDPFIPRRPPRVDAWFGFNPLACARGLVARRRGKAAAVVLWSVDFVPDRFGRGSPLTRLYDRLDRHCCVHADARVELSETAREARKTRHGLVEEGSRTFVVPMGAWLDRVPVTAPNGDRTPRVVFLGHLVERMGVDALVDALAELKARGREVQADVIGAGPLESSLRDRATTLGLESLIRFHGFVPDHQDVERLLAQASLAVAPYRDNPLSLTRFADPGKLKAYVAAGLPILLTDVPPNAAELAAEGGAEIIGADARSLADAIERALASPEEWSRRRAKALAYARRFDWSILLPNLLDNLGFGAGSRGAARPSTTPAR